VQLLVSVRNAQEAASALAGGADIVDAKDPAAGPLGAVSLDVLRAIVCTVAGSRPVTAALGDARDECLTERAADAFVRTGSGLVKVGLAGTVDLARAKSLIASAVRGAGADRVVAVAYADYRRAGSVSPLDVLDLADALRVKGVLLDTADKHGPRLCTLVPPAALGHWVTMARCAGLLVALAGRLTAEDIGDIARTGADVVGVRGAACDGGRDGCITEERVRLLKDRVGLRPAEVLQA
jgi:uncharacterized protein (UPF0264 family)